VLTTWSRMRAAARAPSAPPAAHCMLRCAIRGPRGAVTAARGCPHPRSRNAQGQTPCASRLCGASCIMASRSEPVSAARVPM
jgi:hypothetical protein